MATEASVTDQTTEGHIEEVKLTDDAIKDIDKETCPVSKELRGNDEEKIKVEEAGIEAFGIESEAAIVSEEKQEDEEVEPAVEEVKKEEAEDAKASVPLAGDAIEEVKTSKQEADSSTAVSKEEADSSAAVEPAVETDEKELKDQVDVTDIPEPLKQLIEASEKHPEASLVQESEPETPKEPAVPDAATTNPEATAEEVNTTPEAAAKEVTIFPAAAAEEVNTTLEAAAEEVNATEELPEVSSASVTEGKEAEPPMVSPLTDPAPDDITTPGVGEAAETSQGEAVSSKLEENTESPKEEPLMTNSSKLEDVSEKVQEAVISESVGAVSAEAAPVEELKEKGEEAVVAEEVHDAPKLAEGDQNAAASAEESVSTDTNPVIESFEDLVKVEEEMPEKAVVSEEPTTGDTTTTDAATQVTEASSEGPTSVEKVEEKNEASVEGSVESSKDLGAAAEVPQASSEGEKASEGVEDKKDGSLEGENTTLVDTSGDIDVEEGKNNVNTEGGKTKKDDEQTPVESAKDASAAPKAEGPAKSSQRQSSNIFSKVKQSIVKVKKAIIGKSPSSKTMSAEGKDEIKV